MQLFNNQEISHFVGLTSREYTCHLIAHLLDDVDIVNAKYLLKRVPELTRKRNNNFNQVYNAVTHLQVHAYDQALRILEEPLQAPKQSEGEKVEDYANKLKSMLVWYLQHHIVPRFI